jgi:hypothetical protein
MKKPRPAATGLSRRTIFQPLTAQMDAHDQFGRLTNQSDHAKNPHHARVTAPKTRRAAWANKRAQGSFGYLIRRPVYASVLRANKSGSCSRT